MAIRINIGDIFEVPINSEEKVCLQYIGNDVSALNLDIIRIFKKKYNLKFQLDVKDIVLDSVNFFALVTDIRSGEKKRLWKKIGNNMNIGDLSSVYFRTPNCLMKDKICEKWFVWKVNGERNLLKYDQELIVKANLGIGTLPEDILHRIRYEIYPFVYPKYPGEK